MKRLKTNAIIIFSCIGISYILNCYYYNTFDQGKFPIEAKITTTVLMILAIFLYMFLNDDHKKMISDELERYKNNCPHDWQPSKSLPEYYDTCLKCNCQRGKKH